MVDLRQLTSHQPLYRPTARITLAGGFFILGWIGRKTRHPAATSEMQSREKTVSVPEIRVEELKQRLDAGENVFVLDVRDEFEYEISNIGGQLIPLPELSKRMNELDVNQKIVAVCKMGSR